MPLPETRPAIVTVPQHAASGTRRYRILTRVSDDKLQSIPQQVRACAAYVLTLGPEASIDGIYNLGEQSGFTMTESAIYARLLDDARGRAFHGLVVRDSSRMGRDYWEKMGTIRDLRHAGVELHVVEEGGRFDFEDSLSKVRNFASTWADEEKKREEIRKAIRATEALREEGLPTTRPPYGYQTVKDPRRLRRVWRADPRAAAAVRALFAAVAADPSINRSELARQHGLAPYQAHRILANRAYTGGFTWRGAFHKCDPTVVPPLVDEETFERVQRAFPADSSG